MAITMIYNQLQSIYNGDYKDLQSITIHLQWRLQGFTMIYNDLQSIYN